jgi:predicted signal transduction protein with EAL and GGDEF domain
MASAIPDDHNSQTQLLDEADKALYMAKQSGRNKVVVGKGKEGNDNEKLTNEICYQCVGIGHTEDCKKNE